MSTDEPTPTQYFGPHAKRWTNPDTGVTLSLSPRDYYRAVARQQIREEELRRLRYLKTQPMAEKAEAAITAREEKLLDEAVSAAWNDEALDDRTTADKEWKAVTNGEGTVYDESWPPVISMDTMYDRDLEPEAGLFRHPGILEVEVESSPIPPELAAPTAEELEIDAQLKERFGSRYVKDATPEKVRRVMDEEGWGPDAGLSIALGGAGRDRLVASTDEGDKALLARGEIRYLNVSADDSLGLIRPVEQSAPGKPAARHIRRRKIGRNTLRLGLLYIIAVIGVFYVAGVML